MPGSFGIWTTSEETPHSSGVFLWIIQCVLVFHLMCLCGPATRIVIVSAAKENVCKWASFCKVKHPDLLAEWEKQRKLESENLRLRKEVADLKAVCLLFLNCEVFSIYYSFFLFSYDLWLCPINCMWICVLNVHTSWICDGFVAVFFRIVTIQNLYPL